MRRYRACAGVGLLFGRSRSKNAAPSCGPEQFGDAAQLTQSLPHPQMSDISTAGRSLPAEAAQDSLQVLLSCLMR